MRRARWSVGVRPAASSRNLFSCPQYRWNSDLHESTELHLGTSASRYKYVQRGVCQSGSLDRAPLLGEFLRSRATRDDESLEPTLRGTKGRETLICQTVVIKNVTNSMVRSIEMYIEIFFLHRSNIKIYLKDISILYVYSVVFVDFKPLQLNGNGQQIWRNVQQQVAWLFHERRETWWTGKVFACCFSIDREHSFNIIKKNLQISTIFRTSSWSTIQKNPRFQASNKCQILNFQSL